jgi:hypothetical protein
LAASLRTGPATTPIKAITRRFEEKKSAALARKLIHGIRSDRDECPGPVDESRRSRHIALECALPGRSAARSCLTSAVSPGVGYSLDKSPVSGEVWPRCPSSDRAEWTGEATDRQHDNLQEGRKVSRGRARLPDSLTSLRSHSDSRHIRSIPEHCRRLPARWSPVPAVSV